MSMLARLEHNLEAAIAEQRARHATEDGRDLAREQCVEAMKEIILDYTDGIKPYFARRIAVEALDAAIVSGYVVRPK
jgi:hypothetical protein